MPENLSYDEGAMCEPVSVARHAVLKLDIKGEENVLIYGTGPIGLIAGKWAKMLGAKQVYYIDIYDRKIEFAKELGFLDKEGYENIEIEMDGNVSFENAKLMNEAGANIFVCGTSSIFSQTGSITENTNCLRNILV